VSCRAPCNDDSRRERLTRRINGTQRGARDLTWSHASFLDLARTRRRALLGKGAEGERAEWVAEHTGTVTSTGWTDWLWDLYH